MRPGLLTRRRRAFSLASGSSGNAYFCSSQTTSVLIDAGVSAKRLEAALEAHDEAAGDLDAILITHEHSDHIRGLEVLARRYHLPIYLSEGSYRAIRSKLRTDYAYDIRLVCADTAFQVGDIEVLPVAVSHDAAEPLAFRLEDALGSVGVCTDLGCFDLRQRQVFGACELLYVEANYNEDMLMTGPYSWPLKLRIRGDHGHLSNEDAASFIAALIEQGCENFVLSHLSAQNNQPALAELSVSQDLASYGMVADRDYRLWIAPRHRAGEVYLSPKGF